VIAAVLQQGFWKAILRMEAYNSLQGRALLHGDVSFVGFYQVQGAIAGKFFKNCLSVACAPKELTQKVESSNEYTRYQNIRIN